MTDGKEHFRLLAIEKMKESERAAAEAEKALHDGKGVDCEEMWAVRRAQREAIVALEMLGLEMLAT